MIERGVDSPLFLCYILDNIILYMATHTKGINLGSIRERFPNFDADYAKSWRAIVKRRLATLAAARSASSRLTGVKQETAQFFPYLGDAELDVIQDRISAAFRSSLGHPDWDPWRSQLSKIFEGSEINEERIVTVLNETFDGEAVSISTSIKEETFTVSVVSDNGNQVFQWSGVPKDLAMTSISELTKALA